MGLGKIEFVMTQPPHPIMRNYFTPTPQMPLDFSGFYEEIRLDPKNTLFAIKKTVDFESYRPLLISKLEEGAVGRLSKAGRKPMDPVFMLKVLFLQRVVGEADDRFEFTMKCDRSIQLFLDIYEIKDVPDAKTIWKYREMFIQKGIFDQVFWGDLGRFKKAIPCIGEEIVAIDSSFMEAPKQRNSREENQQIKAGLGEQLWNDNPSKKRHKDVDARWTKKRQETHYGYKLHCTVCLISKMITDAFVTSANVHDAKAAEQLIANLQTHKVDHRRKYDWFGRPKFFADAGYVGKKIKDLVLSKGWEPLICQKGKVNAPLTEIQKELNKAISRSRCRIEHVFGLIEGSLGGLVTRAIGKVRASGIGMLTAWVYNRLRLYQLASLENQ